MTKYTITNTTSGHVLGDYEGATPLAAYREHLTAAGYRETDVRATMARVAAEREADSDWQSIDAADDLDWDTIPADLSVEEVDTTDTPTITAEITGRGKDSQCRDEPGAVDADIYADSAKVGEVTLMPDRQTGELGAWGDLEHWASSDLIDWLDGRDDRQEIISAIVVAVREAAAEDTEADAGAR
jgi:hypothetical protein